MCPLCKPPKYSQNDKKDHVLSRCSLRGCAAQGAAVAQGFPDKHQTHTNYCTPSKSDTKISLATTQQKRRVTFLNVSCATAKF